jgi:LysM repeat protein
MKNRLFLLLNLALVSCLFSCRTYKPIASTSKPRTTPKPDQSVQEYINSYKGLAVTEMNRTGIPASITLAQAIIESDCGHSTLARNANNHFGIKCHDDWTGPSVRHTDNSRNECFRKYTRAEDSFYDHSDFIKSGSRYSFLFNYNPTDYKAWAHGLKKAGYATNPDYANMLIRTIEENGLTYFDRGLNVADLPVIKSDSVKRVTTSRPADSTKKAVTFSNTTPAVMARTPRIMENNRIQYIIVKDGETREKLENEFQLLRWELAKYNELHNDFIPVAGQILYLQPKRDKAEPGKEFYNTAEGDTMYTISQKYGIKLKKLYEMNRMDEGTEPEAGKKIWLRSNKPVN